MSLLTEEQTLHLIDLLEMNIKEKQTLLSLFMTKEMIDEAIAFDMALIGVLDENETNFSDDSEKMKQFDKEMRISALRARTQR